MKLHNCGDDELVARRKGMDKMAHTTNWKVLADDVTSILPVEFGQVTLPSIESMKQ